MADTVAGLPDAALIDVGTQTIAAVNANLANYPGVTQQFVDDLKTLRDEFTPEVTLHVQKQAEARAQTQTKDAKRDPFEDKLIALRNIAKAGGASEAAMAATGIPVGASQAAPTNATVPAAKVNTSERLRHTLDWRDNATPENKRKPRGVVGAEIWVKIDGPPPGSEKDCVFLTLDTKTPYTVEYDSTEANKTAHYMLRWLFKDGSKGAWGETISATITG